MNDVQKTELAVYKEIASVCDKHNLRFFGIGGTCIGAVRHKGFIPWDDDIDIAMPRQDYEALRNEYYKELPEYLKKLDCDNSTQHEYTFMKIHDSRTTYVETYAKGAPQRYTGAFVDIMPIDGLPIQEKELKKVVKSFRRFGYLNARNRPIPFKISPPGYFAKYAIKSLFRVIHKYNYYSDKTLELGSRYKFDDSVKCIFTWRAASLDIPFNRLVFDKDWFSEFAYVPFEDTFMRIPVGYDAYLKQDFEDYMKLPPEDKRDTNHLVFINDMTTPCAFYANRDKRRKK